MDNEVSLVAQNAIEGSRERGYHHAGLHYYTWEPERAAVVSWVRELSPFDRREPAQSPPELR